jgi:hypothetical protein
MKFSEEKLRSLAEPLSDTENEKCLNAISMIRDAMKTIGFTDINKSIKKLYEDTSAYSLEMLNTSGSRKVKLFIQGSYANNTNVRTQSDVDIAIVQEDVFITEYRSSTTYPQSDSDYGFTSVLKSTKSFKDEVEDCLKCKFGADVERKNKSIKVHGNTYRKDADTVPCKRYKDYQNDFSKDRNNFIGGIYITPDVGPIIVNYPEQHIINGRKKNMETDTYYKKMVRIIKNMRYIMSDCGYSSADDVSSFGLESLLWNIPNDIFTKYLCYGFIFDEIVKYMSAPQSYLSSCKEVNDIKKICQTNKDVDKYESYINDLKKFYEYDMEN